MISNFNKWIQSSQNQFKLEQLFRKLWMEQDDTNNYTDKEAIYEKILNKIHQKIKKQD